MKQKLIFLDIDGTLLPPGEMTVPASAVEARQKQKQANRTVLLVLLAILAVGLLIRGFTMNWQ